MSRSIAVVFLILFGLSAASGQEEAPPSDLEQALADAKAAATQAENRLAVLYMEIELDYTIVRSERWKTLRGPYLEVVRARQAEPAGEPRPESEHEAALAAGFTRAGFLSEPTVRRLTAAIAGSFDPGADPSAVLDAAEKSVFPAATFPECWEAGFLDLPEVAALAKARTGLEEAEKALGGAAAPVEKPEHPPGMVLVPRGRFKFGPAEGWTNDLKRNSEDTERAEAFYIDVHEVTTADFRDFLATLKADDPLREELPTGFRVLEDGTLMIPEGAERHPVRGITVAMAMAYAESKGKRLPTEEEWEKAARGEEGLVYPWGEEFDEGAANWRGANQGGPTAVGSFAKDKSPYGVMDLGGNVSELTATLDGRRPLKGRLKAKDSVVQRGGSFTDSGESTKGTYRWILPAISGRSESVGFRCVISQRAWKRSR